MGADKFRGGNAADVDRGAYADHIEDVMGPAQDPSFWAATRKAIGAPPKEGTETKDKPKRRRGNGQVAQQIASPDRKKLGV